jgi:YidC/Oxa1 family membrane protein insertase
MDRKAIAGIVLIVVITLLMPFYQRWITGDQPPRQIVQAPEDTLQPIQDTAGISEQNLALEQEAVDEKLPKEELEQEGSVQIEDAGEVKIIRIETDIINFSWSTERGGNLTAYELKKYKYHQGGNVNLIDENGLKLSFLNVDGKEVELNDHTMFSDFGTGKKVVLNRENPEYVLNFYLPFANGRIVKSIRLYYNKYAFDMAITFEGLQDYVINRKYFIGWQKGLKPTEENAKDDLSYSRAYTFMGDDAINIDASDQYEEEEFKGRVDWAAIRSKYFVVSLIPFDVEKTNGVTIGGVQVDGSENPSKQFDFAIDYQYQPSRINSDSFKVYLGPLDYYILNKYDLELESMVMNKDWYERLFRPISLLIIPAFKFLYRFIPNYGFVIIIFSILIKLILHPLTKKSYQSMSEMQFLQPKMTELREKYKEEPQRLNKEMMKLYKEHGVNPLGGCLPMLLQMPVLFSLFIVFRSTIQLRNEPFIGWIDDLSAPDTLHLGFQLPFIGDSIHILPILMGITMIWQSKISMTDPKQKFMIYFMPVFLIFIFYSLPSGLNLYYAVFNILSMLQTRMIKKRMHPEGEPKPETAGNKPQKSSSSGRTKRKK